MWNVLALFGTPMISLGNLSVVYALATPSCETQTMVWLHTINGTSVALSLLLTAMAWLVRRRPDSMPARPGIAPAAVGEAAAGSDAPARDRRRLLADMAAPLATLFTMVTAAQWVCIWLLSPCQS